jgi:homoserine kinase
MNQVTISIPATSANLGPGFDCLGLALTLRNEFTLTGTDSPTDPALIIEASGVDAHKIPTDASNLFVQSAELIFERVGKRPLTLHLQQHNNIPVGSGLGSSSTAVLGGMLAANALVNGGLSRADILQLATNHEGHPDNVAPALYGGLVLGVQGDDGLHIEQFPIPPLQAVVILPDFHLLTSEARAALPSHIPLKDAIYNTSRIGLLIHALQTADFTKLNIAMQDKYHQPYRIPIIPGMAEAFAAARHAGAAALALSGAGPSLIAFAPANHQAIAAAAQAAFAQAGLASRTWLLSLDTAGACVTFAH